MLVLFLSEGSELRQRFNLSFSYRFSEEYAKGLASKLPGYDDFNPLILYDSADGYRFIENKIKNSRGIKIGKFFVALFCGFLRYPLLIYDLFVFINAFKKQNIDILHINNGGYPGALSCAAAAIAGKIAGIPRIVYVVNNIAVGYNNPKRWLDIPVDMVIRRAVDVFVTGSCYAGSRLKNVLRLPPERITQIYNGVPRRAPDEDRDAVFARLNLQRDRLVVTMVALFEERKGHRFLVEAMERLMRAGVSELPSVVLEGTGPLLESIKTMVEEKGLGEQIRFTEERNVFNLLAISDIVVLPSIKNEDFPNIVIEAMSLGKAVIASDFGGIREQLEDGESGFLVQPGDAEALAEKISLLTEDRSLLKKIGENARRRFSENFTREIALQRYGELYSELLETDKEG